MLNLNNALKIFNSGYDINSFKISTNRFLFNQLCQLILLFICSYFLISNVLLDMLNVEIPPKVSKQYFAFIFLTGIYILFTPAFLIINSYLNYWYNADINFSNLFNINYRRYFRQDKIDKFLNPDFIQLLPKINYSQETYDLLVSVMVDNKIPDDIEAYVHNCFDKDIDINLDVIKAMNHNEEEIKENIQKIIPIIDFYKDNDIVHKIDLNYELYESILANIDSYNLNHKYDLMCFNFDLIKFYNINGGDAKKIGEMLLLTDFIDTHEFDEDEIKTYEKIKSEFYFIDVAEITSFRFNMEQKYSKK